MTNKEAIYLLNHITAKPPKSKELAYKIGRALTMAIEAIEKQIPKKPIGLHKYNFGPIQGKEAECECGTHLFFRDKYCPHCGQAIDWSEDND